MRLFRSPALIALLGLGACAASGRYTAPTLSLPPAFVNDRAAITAEATAPANEWWREFGDPQLDALIAQGLSEGPDIAIAEARLAQAAAGVDAARARLLPNIGLGAEFAVDRRSVESPIGIIASRVPGFDRTQKQYSLTTPASWEIDLFGSLGARKRAALAEAQAASAAVGGARLTLAAEIANAWFALTEAAARRDVAERRLAALDDLARVVQLRFDRGIAARVDLDAVEADRASARGTLALLTAGEETARQSLGVLIGSGAVRAEPAAIAAFPTTAAANGPAALLRRRPDLFIAERKVAASNARLAAALADPWPKLTLRGLVGLVSTTLTALPTGGALLTDGSAGLALNLFDFGRAKAEADRARGAEAEAIAAYRKAVLSAVAETENSFAALDAAARDDAAAVEAVTALRKVRQTAEISYQNGVFSLADVLDVERRLLTAEDRAASARAGHGRAAVAVFRALGGGWQADTVTTAQR